MDFALSSDQQDLQERARSLARRTLAVRAAEYDRTAEYPHENLKALHHAGLLALLVPAPQGGLGADLSTYVLVVTELARACGSTALIYAMHCGATRVVANGAVGDQRAWIDDVVRSGSVFAWGFSEPGSGSNILAPQLTVEQAPGGFRLNGSKSFCTGAGHVDYYLINAKTGEDDFLRSQSLFVFDGSAPGLSVKQTWDGMGMRANSSNTLVLQDFALPETACVGGHGGGVALLAQSLAPLVLGLAAASLGVAQAAAAFAKEHVTTRRRMPANVPLSEIESTRGHIAEIETTLHTANLALMYGAWAADRDPLEGLSAMNLAKLICNRAAITVADHAMQACGGHGYLKSNPLERHYRDARAGAVMGASLDVLKDMIGRSALGMDPRVTLLPAPTNA